MWAGVARGTSLRWLRALLKSPVMEHKVEVRLMGSLQSLSIADTTFYVITYISSLTKCGDLVALMTALLPHALSPNSNLDHHPFLELWVFRVG